MSGNLTAVGKMSQHFSVFRGRQGIVREKFFSSKLFIVIF